MKVEVILPEGYEAVNVSVKNGCLSYELKPKTSKGVNISKPKDGDILVLKHDRRCVFVYREKGFFTTSLHVGVTSEGRVIYSDALKRAMLESSPVDFATEEEKQILFDALAKEGKMWNAEKKEVVRWRAKVGGEYYFVDVDGSVSKGIDFEETIDEDMHHRGNYFYSEELAKESPIYKAYER